MRPARSRAFALPLTLLVLLAVSLIVTVAMQRQAAQTRTIQRQINEYTKRHDAYGVRAIVLHWLKELPASELDRFLSDAAATHLFELPSGARAVVRVEDGQGLPLRNASMVDSDLQEPYQDMLARLASRPDLTRGVGPWQISMSGAPTEVIEAMVSRNGPSFAEEVLRMRRAEGEIDRGRFARSLSTMPIEDDDRRFVTRAAVFDSSLYRVIVETEDWAGKRRYDMLIEKSVADTVVHEWREYAEDELANRRDPADAGRGRRTDGPDR